MATFRPMLAASELVGELTPDDLAILDRLGHFPLLASYKIDGIRAIVYQGQLVSRTLKPIPSKYAQQMFSRLPEGFDGELIADTIPEGDTLYHASYSAAMTHGAEVPLTLCLFDWVSTAPYKTRLHSLFDVWRDMGPFPDHKVILLDQAEVRSVDELLAFEKRALEHGYEGLVVRRGDAPYKFGRSTLKQGYLIKIARTLTGEAVIEDFEEQMENTNEAVVDARGYTKRSSHQANLIPKGLLGAFWVRDIKTGQYFKIGTGDGLDMALRQHIWENRAKYLGRIVKYRYKPHGTKDLPRHPVWIGWRDPGDM